MDEHEDNVKGRPFVRNVKYGGFSLAITLVFVVVVVLLNLLVASLSERYSLRLDLTKDQIFMLSTESERFLHGLDKDVRIYVLSAEEYFAGGNLYYIQANDVLRQYAARNPHISLEYVDLPRNPGFESRFPGYQLSSYSVIVQSGEQTVVILLRDLFNIEFDEYTYTEYIASSKAEQVLTAAIMNVTAEERIGIVILDGFGEGGAEALAEVLLTNNYVVMHQNILIEEISDDADIAIICAPMRDYTEAELSKLDRFLQNGGLYSRSLLYFPSVSQPPTPNLHTFLSDWGIAVEEGVVYQSDYAKLVTMNNYWSAADYTEEVYAKPVIERRLLTVVPEARPLAALYREKGSISVFAPLSFTETTLVVPVAFDGELGSEDIMRYGPIPAFLVATNRIYNTSLWRSVESHVLVFGSVKFIDGSLLSSRTVGNLDYMLNALAVISDRSDSVYIAPKSIGAQEFPITGNIVIALGSVFVVVLPLSVVLVGAIVFFRRRRL